MATVTELKSPQKVWTDEAFMALSKDGHQYEIINGKLVDMGCSEALHGYVCSLLLKAPIFFGLLSVPCSQGD